MVSHLGVGSSAIVGTKVADATGGPGRGEALVTITTASPVSLEGHEHCLLTAAAEGWGCSGDGVHVAERGFGEIVVTESGLRSRRRPAGDFRRGQTDPAGIPRLLYSWGRRGGPLEYA
jgi:hypothetical protein